MTTPSTGNQRPDFLGQLIERSTESGAAVEPRLPSLFEPAPWTAQKNIFGSDDEAAPPAEEEIALPARPRRPLSANPEPDEVDRRSSIRVQDAEPDRRGTVARRAETSEPHDRAGAMRSVVSTETIRRIVTDRVARESPPAAAAPSAHSEVREAADAKRPARGESTPPAVTETSRANEHPPQAEPITPLRATYSQHVIAEPAVLIGVSGLLRDPSPAGATERTPVINVTIGRLEIRAAKEATPAKRAPAPGAQPMSLEDYMKQRGRGR